jgi:predicted DCC family thiol-disulfide oxidoreductase YuxK
MRRSAIPATNYLVYDGACPFCTRFVTYTRLRHSIGSLPMIDSRSARPEVDEVSRLGFDLDQGMVLKLEGAFYHGAACVHVLALLSTRSGLFNRTLSIVFRSPVAARLLYPPLRGGRNLTLFLLGRRRLSAGRA